MYRDIDIGASVADPVYELVGPNSERIVSARKEAGDSVSNRGVRGDTGNFLDSGRLGHVIILQCIRVLLAPRRDTPLEGDGIGGDTSRGEINRRSRSWKTDSFRMTCNIYMTVWLLRAYDDDSNITYCHKHVV